MGLTTCEWCGRTAPDDEFHLVAQVSNPVTYRPFCNRVVRCWWRTFLALIRGRDD